ncbi:MAG: vitamin K epoxide reductase family protein, partial [Anaerolineales bacterium]
AGGRFMRGRHQKSRRTQSKRSSGWGEYLTPVLALLGLGVAGYLAYVETQAVSAICGPVGDCNTVQSSPYARLFGVLHIGVLGVVGYILILAAWMWKRLRSDRLAMYASLAIFGMAFFGTLFSLYLTYLEPFVIRAVCAWCLASAVLITLLMLVNVTPALQSAKIKK